MRQVFLIVGGVFLGVCALAVAFTAFEAQQERATLTADLQYRTLLLAESLKESIEPAFAGGSTNRLEKIAANFTGREKLLGIAVYDGSVRVASSTGLGSEDGTAAVAARAIERNIPTGEFGALGEQKVFVYATPLHAPDRAGAFVIVQDASYIDQSVSARWRDNLAGVLTYLFLFSLAIAALVRYVIFRPLMHLVDAIQSARSGRTTTMSDTPRDMFFRPLSAEIAKLTASLSQARTAASEEARMRLEKIDAPWTAERLREFVNAYLKDRPIFVVSNAEPFVHKHEGREITYSTPAGGVVTAVGAMMEACGGMWIAYGGGDADKETVDENDIIKVPPDEPKYALKRVWLSDEEYTSYYGGFANEALWPLCHNAHVRPQFRSEDWAAYCSVNQKFADALLKELEGIERPIVLVQDYHLALLPQIIKRARPDAQVAIFWHIPWPSAEQFSVCPLRKEILMGMLGADVIGFHTQQFCNNFMETVGKEIESLMDFERFAITRDLHTSFVKPFPISIGFTGSKHTVEHVTSTRLAELGIKVPYILGVDRLDYTKGILERFRGLEYLLDTHPEYRGAVSLLQISSPTRGGIEKYRTYAEDVEAEAERINNRFKKNGWQPIYFEHRHYSHRELRPLYRGASACLVTSVHDGMNLVAKEFVAARDDELGVLILSQFAGAARDLPSSLIVNPYSAEETAAAIDRALTMPKPEQRRRMKELRDSVKDYNIYRWAAELVRAVAQSRSTS